jgi:hypothetical protein
MVERRELKTAAWMVGYLVDLMADELELQRVVSSAGRMDS